MKSIVLNGQNLTAQQIYDIACCDVKVTIAPESIKLIEEARQLVFDLVDDDVPVYGFNVGVGWNKDKAVYKDFFQKYNTSLILSHSLGVKPYLSCQQAKAVLVARLNNFLIGCTGVQPYIVTFYQEMINNNLVPLIPLRGSVGNADITNLPHIGLTMLGLGKAFLNGELINADDALEKIGLKPVDLGPKDGLAIVSSNAFSSGIAALLINETTGLLNNIDIVNCLIIDILAEKVNTELTPFIFNNNIINKFNHYFSNSNNIDNNIKNSSLVNNMIQVNGSATQHLNRLNSLLEIQLNSSDDNPCLILEKREIISCANYEPTNWALAVETLALVLCNSAISIINNLKTLDADINTINIAQSLANKMRHQTLPSNCDFFSLAGDIEDHGNNTPYLVSKANEILENLFQLVTLELDIIKKTNSTHINERSQTLLNTINNSSDTYKLLKSNRLNKEVISNENV